MANTISDELYRLIQAKTNIRTALQEKCGLTILDSSTLDEYPGLIQEMEVGGGGSDTSTIIDLIEGDITSIDIPEGTKIIKQSCFANTSLNSVSIPNSVTTILQKAFSYTQLTSLLIPNSVTSLLGGYITQGCNSLNEVILLPINPPQLGFNSPFPSTNNQTPVVYVQGKAYDTYYNYNIGNWSDIKNRLKPLASATYDTSTYTVTASGRDNLELYIDASLYDSSTYTFDSTTQTGNHTVTVKSVDPSLGVLDEVSQEITI